MASVLVLGSTGLLGSMVLDYFARATDHLLYATTRTASNPLITSRYPNVSQYIFDVAENGAGRIEEILSLAKPDYVINCIGVIKPYCKDNDPKGVRCAILVNALFPHELAKAAEEHGAKVLQIATDCVWSGEKGEYLPTAPHDALDAYGKTKSLGEVENNAIVHVRSSIIGPELKGKVSLMEWVLGQPDGGTIQGFTHHRWNGVTTLQYAKLMNQIVSDEIPFKSLRAHASVHHYTPNLSLNKYELVSAIAEVFGKKITIEPTDSVGNPVDRTIGGGSDLLNFKKEPMQPIRDALIELREYMRESSLYL